MSQNTGAKLETCAVKRVGDRTKMPVDPEFHSSEERAGSGSLTRVQDRLRFSTEADIQPRLGRAAERTRKDSSLPLKWSYFAYRTPALVQTQQFLSD